MCLLVCQVVYEGKTKWDLEIRISDHETKTKNRDERSPVPTCVNAAVHYAFLNVSKCYVPLKNDEMETGKHALQNETLKI